MPSHINTYALDCSTTTVISSAAELQQFLKWIPVDQISFLSMDSTITYIFSTLLIYSDDLNELSPRDPEELIVLMYNTCTHYYRLSSLDLTIWFEDKTVTAQNIQLVFDKHFTPNHITEYV
jgi:hypothetical protein